MKSGDSILKALLVTEKGTRLTAAGNKYVFRVAPAANKMEIRAAVEKQFKVNVLRVNTINVMGKMKRERTPQYGRQANWKKAIVTLKAGDKIDLQ